MNEEVLLSVKQLETEFLTDNGAVKILHGVSFDVKKGRTLGLVVNRVVGKASPQCQSWDYYRNPMAE